MIIILMNYIKLSQNLDHSFQYTLALNQYALTILKKIQNDQANNTATFLLNILDKLIQYTNEFEQQTDKEQQKEEEEEEEAQQKKKYINKKICHLCHNILNDKNIRICSSCHQVVYCSYKCQVKDWKNNHKKICKKY